MAQPVNDPDPPSAWRRRSRYCDVAAQVYQDACSRGGRDGRRGPVGRQRFGSGAKIQLDTRRYPNCQAGLIKFDAAPATGRYRRTR